ncbi:hypothetical protein KDW36_13695 [Burkholderia dolosa]|uniref:hypothetical protein n=1 Tax=Burkholderia dolosa TaxID=152500 RepID=UPI001B97D7D0|nr:hypothetical protein [Burkholderia dolosa]MBR8314246.1 hypothetical protein [Burkholderia dolosa]
MYAIDDFTDDRNKAWCIHCGKWLNELKTNRDHVPTKGLLRKPYPDELPLIEICRECNSSFSLDEEYLIAFLGSVICGSTDPEKHSNKRSARILQRTPKLKNRIERAKVETTTITGEKRLLWKPEQERICRVVVKNARGHVYFEYGEPMLSPPTHVGVAPLETLDKIQREEFEGLAAGNEVELANWPEVGSRMMTRLLTGQNLNGPWVIVQEGVYRYSILQQGFFLVRIVIEEYLAAEILWDE